MNLSNIPNIFSYVTIEDIIFNGNEHGFNAKRNDGKIVAFYYKDYLVNGKNCKGYFTLLKEGVIFNVKPFGKGYTFDLKASNDFMEMEQIKKRTHYSYTTIEIRILNKVEIGFNAKRDDGKIVAFSYDDYFTNGKKNKGYFTLLKEGKISNVKPLGEGYTFDLKVDPNFKDTFIIKDI